MTAGRFHNFMMMAPSCWWWHSSQSPEHCSSRQVVCAISVVQWDWSNQGSYTVSDYQSLLPPLMGPILSETPPAVETKKDDTKKHFTVKFYLLVDARDSGKRVQYIKDTMNTPHLLVRILNTTRHMTIVPTFGLAFSVSISSVVRAFSLLLNCTNDWNYMNRRTDIQDTEGVW